MINVHDVYRHYLYERQNVVEHPINIGSVETLLNRNDYKLFKKLFHQFLEKGFSESNIKAFMQANAKRLGHKFFISELVQESAFDNYYNYCRNGNGTEVGFVRTLKKSGRFIDEKLANENIESREYFCCPTDTIVPQAIMDCSENNICEEYPVYAWQLFEYTPDFDKIHMFIDENLFNNIDVIINRIKKHEKIRKILEMWFNLWCPDVYNGSCSNISLNVQVLGG